MTVKYDSAVIYGFAERLYTQARTIAITYGVLGFLIGWAGAESSPGLQRYSLVFGGIFAALGVYVGFGAAAKLRLQAQTALCHAQIEENTRPR